MVLIRIVLLIGFVASCLTLLCSGGCRMSLSWVLVQLGFLLLLSSPACSVSSSIPQVLSIITLPASSSVYLCIGC